MPKSKTVTIGRADLADLVELAEAHLPNGTDAAHCGKPEAIRTLLADVVRQAGS